MGTGKKEANRKIRQGKTGDGMANVRVKGENFFRNAKKLKVLSMYKDGKPQRNAEGNITKAASFQSRDIPNARIEPNRKWFNNTRVISQDSLNAFRKALDEKSADPYQVLLKPNKIPLSLIRDGQDTTNGVKQHQAKMTVETAPFSDTFGPKAQRKRVKVEASSLTDMVDHAEKSMGTYKDRLEQTRLLSGNSGGDGDKNTEYGDQDESYIAIAKEPIFNKGQSKRIWNELYRVLDSSDVVIHVLDARDPVGTRCLSVEKYLREEAPHKHLIFVLNKTDLVPTGVAAAWVRHLSKERPTLAFHSSLTNPFGKGSLIELLRQYAKLHHDRKQVSVGLIGYPNVGKSSIVNTLRKKKVCTTAPIPGETKVWQYITLTKRLYLIDCPGIVPPASADTPQDLLLRGVVRVENVEYPSQYIAGVFEKVKKHHLERTYELKGWETDIEFLEMLARRGGRLLKKGEPDIDGVAKMVLNDMMRGKLPWFTPPPKPSGVTTEKGIEGRGGRLGEMPQKRKRDDIDSLADTSMGPSTPNLRQNDDKQSGQDKDDTEADFEGFESDVEEALQDKLPRKPKDLADDGSEDMIPLDASSDESEDDESGGDSDSASSDQTDDDEGADLDASDPSDDDSDGELATRKQSTPAKKRRRT